MNYPDGFFEWYLGQTELAGRLVSVALNGLTRYPVIFLPKEQKTDPTTYHGERSGVWKEAVSLALTEEGFHPGVVRAYLAYVDEAAIPVSRSREMLQKMRYTCRLVSECAGSVRPDCCLQAELGRKTARAPVRFGEEFASPLERMMLELERFRRREGLSVPLMESEAAELRIDSGEENGLSAIVTVPVNVSLQMLHRIIGILFAWRDEGEGCFFTEEKEASGRSAVQTLAESLELKELDPDHPLLYRYRGGKRICPEFRITVLRRLLLAKRTARVIDVKGRLWFSPRETDRELDWLLFR